MLAPLTGLIAAAYTPLDDRGHLREGTIDQLAEHFVATGVAGVFVCGTTGECHSLTVEERRRTLRRWCQAADGRLKIIAHVGSNCLPDSMVLAADAAQCGADAIASMAPFFFRPRTVDQLAAHLAPIASAAPDTPFYYYDIPSMTGVELPTDELLAACGESIPNLRGVKYTRNDNLLLQSCLAANEGQFDILFGHDENLLTGLVLGARGAIGSTYNYAAPLYVRLIDEFQRKNLERARQLQWRSAQLVQVLMKHGGVRAGKEIMGMLGIDCGPVRVPLPQMLGSEVKQLRDDLDNIGFFGEPYSA